MNLNDQQWDYARKIGREQMKVKIVKLLLKKLKAGNELSHDEIVKLILEQK